MINGGGGAFGWACTSCAQVSGERVGGLCGGRGVPCHHPIPLPIRLEVKDCRGRAADPDILFLYRSVLGHSIAVSQPGGFLGVHPLGARSSDRSIAVCCGPGLASARCSVI